MQHTFKGSSQLRRRPARGAHTASSLAVAIASVLAAFAAPVAHAGEDSDSGWERPQREAIVYTESNISTPGGNSILAYSRERGGRLKPLPGSPFSTRGTGVIDASLALGPFDSDQLITTNAEHTLLFAVNPGSNSVAVFHIQPDGALVHVQGSPFPSGGSNPVSVGLAKDTLVVVNKAMDPAQTVRTPNYASFHVAADGQLSPLAASIVSVTPGSSPSQALVPANARFAFGSDFLGGTLQSFAIQADGSLTQNLPQRVADLPFTGSAAPHLALGLAAHPSRPIVYAGLVTISKVAVYQYDGNGVLSFVRAVDDSGAGVCWIRVSADGTRMYTSNTGDNSISVYDTTDPFKPVQIQRQVLKGVGSSFQLELDASGRTLFAISQRAAATTPLGEGSNLHVLNVRPDGRVVETEHSPLALPVPANTRPQGLATL